ncbi:MAG: hypothetical protein HONBIEJF_01141 [Fimbriimonadaceae bacterium]|nr:hypothetical protein [Fimbriimonadaceae bacterium]
MKRKKGFTLIELLTVIAIISILAAIIFPVFARAKDSANKSSDMSNMNSIRTALQLYRIDQGGYPPALFGYVNTYKDGSTVMPIGEATGFLYPKRVVDWKAFQPAYNRFATNATTFAQWPAKDQRAVGSAPQIDLNGDGLIDSNDDPAGARQRYGHESTGWVRPDGSLTSDQNEAARFYKVDGYDVTEVKLPDGSGQLRPELRYTRFWTEWGLGSGNTNDDPRQLGYSDPPDDTVVTWNSFFRELDDNDRPERVRRDMVLFLGGGTRNMDSRTVSEQSWRQERQ